MNPNLLILLIGLPRSGKTTWAKKQKHPIVNPDAVRLALHGKAYLALAEPMVWAIVRYMVTALFTAGHETVILDACNNSRKRRDPWGGGAWSREFVVIRATPSECLARVPEDDENAEGLRAAIERMAEQHEPVEYDEGPVSYVEAFDG